MKIGVFTVMLPDMTPETAATALREAGYDGVEWRVTHIPHDTRREAPSFWGNNLCTLDVTEADALRARDLAKEAGLAVIGLGTYLSVDDISTTEQAMRFAQTADAPQIRVAVGRPAPGVRYADLFEATQTYLHEVEKLARRYNVKALIEMHHRTIAPSASLTHRIVSHFDPALIGVIYDVGNMVYEGYEDYRIGLELLGPYLAHVHLKNAAFVPPEGGGVWTPHWAPLEDGVVDFVQFFAALKATGYDGWLVLEDFSKARPTLEALRYNLAFVKAALARA